MTPRARRASLLVTVPRVGAAAIEASGLHPPLRRLETAKGVLYLMGHPIAKGRRDDSAVAMAFTNAADLLAFARELDGNFLVFISLKEDNSFHVVSDRFASHSFYWTSTEEAGLIGSAFLPQLVARLGGIRWNEASLVEFLHFRRVFGEKTHDQRCHFLASASILSTGAIGLLLHSYWQPDYAGPRHDRRSGADAIAKGLAKSMRMHMESSEDYYGLLLSGGLDSRALLAAASQKPGCVTTCQTYNNEAAVAKECADLAGASFSFVPRPALPYDRHLGDAAFYGSGNHILTEGHFFGYQDALDNDRCWFLGLGLDIFFGGLYLAKKPALWFGRAALHEHLQPLEDDIVGMFMRNVKYRLRTSDPWQVIHPTCRGRLQESLRHSVGEIAERGRTLAATGHDLWEHFHLHNLGRHYSFLMLQSVRHWGECRAPGLCNDLLDAAIALPAEDKVNSQAYLLALDQLSPDLMRLRNANTNITAGRSLRTQSAIRAARILANRLGGNFQVSPAASERSWPSPAQTIAASPALKRSIAELGSSDELNEMGFVDLDAVRAHVDDHMGGRKDHAILLLMLVTLVECSREMRGDGSLR